MTPPDNDGPANERPKNDLPEARFIPAGSRRLTLIWLLPVLALIVGLWLLTNLLAQRGPTVSISFSTAEGIAPGKTRIRYKEVDIGEVREVTLAPDRSHVLVKAQLVAGSDAFLAADTRYWVVRPRVSGGKVSGIGTLLSGAYIGVDVGKSEETSKEFTGLEVAPILTRGLPGRQFQLEAADIGSLDIGSPVYFRRIQVGEVIAHHLERDGSAVQVTVFVHAPYDRYVKPHTRFWNGSGIDVSLDAGGVRLQSQSLLSVMLGGIVFETPPKFDSLGQLMAEWEAGQQVAEDAEVAADAVFTLHPDRTTALKAQDGDALQLTAYFEGSLRGLQPGAPVDFRGIPVGEVLAVSSYYDEATQRFRFPVRLALYAERIALRGKDRRLNTGKRLHEGLQQAIARQGLRAQLRNGSLLTGQLYVALDYFPDVAPIKLDWRAQPFQLPTVPGDFETLQATLMRLMARVDKLPLEQIAGDLHRTLTSLDTVMQRLDKDLAPELGAALKELRGTLAAVERVVSDEAPVQQELRAALQEVSRAARSVRALSDTLEQQPEALLRGKTEANP